MITFDPQLNFASGTLTIVGLGGTGANLAMRIGRILFAMKSANIQIPEGIVLIDPDRVEQRNIGRQMFLKGDVGETKVVTVMRHLNAAYGLNVSAIQEPVSATHLIGSKLILGCVDGPGPRAVIAEFMSQNYTTYASCPIWIDGGNDKESGQVVLGNSSVFKISTPDHGSKYTKIPMPSLLMPSLLMPSLLEETVTQPLSCADLVLRWEQDMLINDWVALVMAQYTKRLLLREPVTSFLTYVASNYMVAKTVPLTELRRYMKRVELVAPDGAQDS